MSKSGASVRPWPVRDLSPHRSPLSASLWIHSTILSSSEGKMGSPRPIFLLAGRELRCLSRKTGGPAPLPRSTCRRSSSRSCGAECSSCRWGRSRGRTGSPPRSSGCSRSWGGWRRSGAGTRSRSSRSGCWEGRRRLQRETRVRMGHPQGCQSLPPGLPSPTRGDGGLVGRKLCPPPPAFLPSLLMQRLYGTQHCRNHGQQSRGRLPGSSHLLLLTPLAPLLSLAFPEVLSNLLP